MFKDIFEEQRKKLQNYFGVGKPGLGTFGQQASNVLKPIVNRNIQNYQKAGRYLSSQPSLAQRYTPVVGPIRSIVSDIKKPTGQSLIKQAGLGFGKEAVRNFNTMSYAPRLLSRKLYGNQVDQPVRNITNRINTAIDSRPATTWQGKTARFAGENAPYFAIPALPGAAKVGTNLTRFGKNTLIRGGEGALYGAGRGMGEGKDWKGIAKDAATGFAFGAGANALLSPKVTTRAMGEAKRGIQKGTQKYMRDVDFSQRADEIARTYNAKSIFDRLDDFGPTSKLPWSIKSKLSKQLVNDDTGEKVMARLKEYLPQADIVNVNYYKTSRPGFAKIPGSKPDALSNEARKIEFPSNISPTSNEYKQIYAKKYGIRPLEIGETIQKGDVGYAQPGATKFEPTVGKAYTNDMHPIYRKVTPNEAEKIYPLSPQSTPSALSNEARKYKSAEEFANSQMSKDFVSGVSVDVKKADNTMFTKTSSARAKSRELTDKAIEGARRQQAVYDNAKTKTIPQLQDEIAKLKEFAQKEGASEGALGIPIKEQVLREKQQLTDIWNKAQSQPLSTPKTAATTPPNEVLPPSGTKLPISTKNAQVGISRAGVQGEKGGIKLETKQVVEPKVRIKSQVQTPESTLPQREVQKVSQKVGSDVSFDNIVQKTETSVKDKVNLLDMFRTPDRVLKKIGLEQEAKTLRTQYDKYLKELPQEIDKISNWSKQTTAEENKRIFKYLDGQDVKLSPKESKIAGEVRSYLEDWAEKLKLPKDKRITNYITHIFDKDLVKKEFPEELARIIDDKVAGSVYDPFTSERLGKKGYIEDTWRALDAYVKRATRKYNIDTALEPIKKKAETLELSQFKYVKNYIDRINMRPTELDDMVDNFLKSTPIGYKLGQRPTTELTRNARQMVYRGTLGFNVGSTLKNLSQGANTYARLGEKYTAKGYLDLFKNYRSSELKDVGVLADDIIQDKNIGVYKSFLNKFDKALFWMFETAEKINRGAAYYGAKAKALNEGKTLQEAIDFAKKTVRDTQFTFGSIDTPPVLQSDAAKTLLQFQSFNIKQGEFLGEMISKKDLAGLTRWIGASLAFVYGVGAAIGMQPKDIIPTIRVGGSPIFGAIKEGYGAITGAPDQYGNKPENIKERITPFAKSLIPIIPGGVQAKKTIEGLGAATRGYVKTAAGNVRNPITPNMSNKIRGALFGQNNLPESRQYFDTKQSPLGEEQSKIFKTVSDKAGYYSSILKERATGKEIDSLKSGNGGVASDGTVVKKVGDKWRTFETEQEAQKELDKYNFDKSGKKSDWINNVYWYKDKSGDPKSLTRDEYDYKVVNLNMDLAYNRKDYQGWVKLANQKLQLIEKQYQNADEMTQLDLLNDYQDLAAKIAKYQSYGGFTKGKKASVSSLSGISNLTGGIKLPVRQAKKPTFKSISSTPKIKVVSTKPKVISKSTLANIR